MNDDRSGHPKAASPFSAHADGVQSAPQPPDRLPAGRYLRAELAAVHSWLLRELRVGMLEEAADAGIDLIAT